MDGWVPVFMHTAPRTDCLPVKSACLPTGGTDLEADVDGVAEGVHAGLALRLGGAGEVPELARHHLLPLQRREVVLEGEALVVHLRFVWGGRFRVSRGWRLWWWMCRRRSWQGYVPC